MATWAGSTRTATSTSSTGRTRSSAGLQHLPAGEIRRCSTAARGRRGRRDRPRIRPWVRRSGPRRPSSWGRCTPRSCATTSRARSRRTITAARGIMARCPRARPARSRSGTSSSWPTCPAVCGRAVRLLLIAPPGAGKGTQGERLAAWSGVRHIAAVICCGPKPRPGLGLASRSRPIRPATISSRRDRLDVLTPVVIEARPWRVHTGRLPADLPQAIVAAGVAAGSA